MKKFYCDTRKYKNSGNYSKERLCMSVWGGWRCVEEMTEITWNDCLWRGAVTKEEEGTEREVRGTTDRAPAGDRWGCHRPREKEGRPSCGLKDSKLKGTLLGVYHQACAHWKNDITSLFKINRATSCLVWHSSHKSRHKPFPHRQRKHVSVRFHQPAFTTYITTRIPTR